MEDEEKEQAEETEGAVQADERRVPKEYGGHETHTHGPALALALRPPKPLLYSEFAVGRVKIDSLT